MQGMISDPAYIWNWHTFLIAVSINTNPTVIHTITIGKTIKYNQGKYDPLQDTFE